MSVAPQVMMRMDGVVVAHPSDPNRTMIGPVDWEVRSGECWVVSGFQGSGKSALLGCVAGLNPCAEGRLRLLGEDLRAARGEDLTRLRCRLGMVFAGTGRLLPALSVLENVALPLRYHRNLDLPAAVDVVRPLLQALQLEPLAAVVARRLPPAWAHRAALARALTMQPELVLLDDPLAGLDPMHLRWWRDMIRELHTGHAWMAGRPLTMVMATDELRPTLGLGDRFAVIDRRAWRVLGGRDDVMTSADPLVRDLIGDSF